MGLDLGLYNGWMGLTRPIRIDDIIARVQDYRDDCDEFLLRKAYVFAAKGHEGQIRRSGEKYLIHPLTVAWILADMELDEVSIAVGLLHDILEDTQTGEEEMEQTFGAEITRLVIALTKISVFQSSFRTHEEKQAENFRKLLFASTDDIRVLLIKLADRLHNMRTLNFLDRDRQVAIARETLDIYAPIANRLGIGAIKGELEDLCFNYLHPKAAERLEKDVQERAAAAGKWFESIRGELESLLASAEIQAEIRGRIKHRYSIYKKLKAQGIDVSSVFDFVAFRIIVGDVSTCYGVLGLMHQRWAPVPGRFKDYIATPKPNAYQSIHTTVIGPEGHPFEIQIRTREMHRVAEYGIAAHWNYKEGGSAPVPENSPIAWLRGVLDDSGGGNAREFLDSLKVNLYQDEVYAFTPKGEVRAFPKGATILDFAYTIHTDVGHHCVGGKVDGRWVPLKTELTNGNMVEITTSPQQTPNHEWLSIVVTGRARSKIRAYLKKEEKLRAIALGRKLLEREFRRHGLSLKRGMDSEEIHALRASHGLAHEDDLFAAVGFGRMAPSLVVNMAESDENAEVFQLQSGGRAGGGALEVTGDSDFLVYIAKCCNPVRGEKIVGYVTRGRGVAVHSADCPNVRKLLYHPDREIEVCWSGEGGGSEVALNMVYRDESNMLASISSVVSSEGSGIVSCDLKTDTDQATGSVSLIVKIQDAAQLRRIMDRLDGLGGMIEVVRRGSSSG